ncbi:MAG: alpha/beta fold hydrolase [Caldilineales bacterium]|nr:alpha/beta fold hydrolase [Caldilineales bacterium]
MKAEISFRNDDVLLKGTLTKPKTNDPCPVVVVTHASHAPTREFGVYQHLADVLPAHGIAAFVYDRRGSGESTGDFATASFFDLADDALAAIASLKSSGEIDPERICVWGMSQGGWIAPLAAANSSDIACVVAVSSVGMTPAEQMNYSAEFELRAQGFSEQAIGRMLALRDQVDDYYREKAERSDVQQMLDSARQQPWFQFGYFDDSLPENPLVEKWRQEMDFDPLPVMRKIAVPILLLYAERDPWVPIAPSIARWQEHGPGDLTVHQIEGANHFMISIAHAGIHGDEGPLVDEYSDILTRWLKRQFA